jgi:hypothetical protein
VLVSHRTIAELYRAGAGADQATETTISVASPTLAGSFAAMMLHGMRPIDMHPLVAILLGALPIRRVVPIPCRLRFFYTKNRELKFR